MNSVAKSLIALGGFLIVAGLFWQFGAKWLPLGKLPGDIAVQKGNLRFYFPLATCLLVSAAISLLLWLIRLFGR